MASEKESMKQFLLLGCWLNDILLFHCISSYPAPLEEANLKNIVFLANKYSVEVGLSDHTTGNTAAIASVALGATAIEKHFTISRNQAGPDSSFSIEPHELKELVRSTSLVHSALGIKDFARANIEQKSKVFRRSLYFVKKLKKGHLITTNDIRRIRPGFGLKPKYFDDVVGKVLNSDVEPGDRVSWDLLK